MADPHFWRTKRELSILAQIASELGVTIKLRGSVVQQLLAAAARKDETPTLFAHVPAFADIDLVTNTAADAERVADASRLEVADSGFFHWEIRTPADLERYRGLANIELSGQPEIELAGPKSRSLPQSASLGSIVLGIRFYSDDGGFQYSDDSKGWEASQVQIARVRAELEPPYVFADILYVLARHESLRYSDAFATLLKFLINRGGRAVAEDLSADPQALRRTTFALLKFLIHHLDHQLATGTGPEGIQSILDAKFCAELAKALSPATALRNLMDVAQRPPRRRTLIATVVPQPIKGSRGRRWTRQVQFVQVMPEELPRQAPEALRVTLREEVEGEPEYLRVHGPPAKLVTAEPPDPGCCGYRDFDRGVAEVAWVEPHGNPPSNRRFGLISDATRTTDGTTFLAHGLLSGGAIPSMRLDYGFLCVMAGQRRNVNLYRVDNSDAG
jgi:hypothetical protein